MRMLELNDSLRSKHPQSIAIVNYKGGVGKTTVTYLLGLYLALKTGRKTLLIDIDAQCSLTLALGFDPEEISRSQENVYSLVCPKAWPLISKIKYSTFPKPIPDLLNAPLYTIPGAFQVEDLDIEITEAIFERRERSKDEFFLYCRQILNAFSDFHYVLIDTPPNKMYLTQGMLRASSFFLPVTIPDAISVYGMPRLLRWIEAIEPVERPKLLGYVLNAINRSGGSSGGKVISQQVAAADLDHTLRSRLSRYELTMMENSLCIGEIPRLDQIAQFLGARKEVRLDFVRHTSGQPTVDQCMTKLTSRVKERIEAYNASIRT